jgi:hypothetical protein
MSLETKKTEVLNGQMTTPSEKLSAHVSPQVNVLAPLRAGWPDQSSMVKNASSASLDKEASTIR